MNLLSILSLISTALTALSPILSGGATPQNIVAAGENLLPTISNIVSAVNPAAASSVAPVVSAVTNSFDTNAAKWVQNTLNAAGAKLTVDGIVGSATLAALDNFGQSVLGIVPGSPASLALRALMTSLTTA